MPKYKITAPDGSKYEITAPDNATEAEILSYAQKNLKSQAQNTKPIEPEKSTLDEILAGAGNLLAGGVRGAGSIGSTLITAANAVGELSPIGLAKRYLKNESLGANLSNIMKEDTQRRQNITSALEDLGADSESLMFKTGKLGLEIAGTAGAGGAIANAARAALPVAAATRAAPLLSAIETSGMRAGGLEGAKGLATRVLGGGITGGASTALVSPEDTGAGAALSAALPPALKVAGNLGKAVAGKIRAPEQSNELAAAINKAREAGFVIPPTQANPNLKNRLIEGMAGKLTTAQNASAKNKEVFDNLAAEAIGLPRGTRLTPELVQDVRTQAGKAYESISNSGMVTPSESYFNALDEIAKPHLLAMRGFPDAKPSPVIDLVASLKSPQFDASAAVSKIKELRTAADDAFRSGNTDIGRASKKAAKELENVLEEHLSKTNQPEMLEAFKDARQLIAKTYTIENAMNKGTGTIDAKKIARQLDKGKPLTGQLKDIAEFASRFPKASQAIEGMGSLPQTSPLDWIAGTGVSLSTASPLGLLSIGARPAARSLALSPIIQNRLIQQNNNLRIPLELQQLGYQALPVIANQ